MSSVDCAVGMWIFFSSGLLWRMSDLQHRIGM